MATSYLMGAAMGLGAGLIGITSAFAGPAIATDWAPTEMSHADCLNHGEAAIRQLGFGNVERTRYSVYGQIDDYTVAVRCVEEKGVTIFLAAGPYRDRTINYQTELHRNFAK